VASLAPQIKPHFCAEKQCLIEAFTHAVSEYLRAQSAQSLSVTDGRDFQFEAEIVEARNRKEAAKRAVLAHQRENGC